MMRYIGNTPKMPGIGRIRRGKGRKKTINQCISMIKFF